MAILSISTTKLSPLVQAIFSRNAEEVTFLLSHREDVNSLDHEQSTPLHAAAYLGDIHIMELLITAGASINAKDQGLLTPLHRAAASKNERAVELLLKHSAEINTRDKFWHTPLHMAAANWATGCAQSLIPHVCSLDVYDRSGRTPLHHAAHSGHGEMVNLLLSKGANASGKDKKERQPIHWAAYLGKKVSFPPRPSPALQTDEPNTFGNTALHMACDTGQETVAYELINCGANINQPNHHGITPLHLAAASSSGVLCVELLLNNGADVNMQSKKGKSPLHMAAMHGRFTGSQILIQNGKKRNCRPDTMPLQIFLSFYLYSTIIDDLTFCRQGIHGMLPLHLAALYGFSDCCRKLLTNGQYYNIVHSPTSCQTPSFGFDVNTQDELGRTCLHAAAFGGNVDCLNMLVNSGAEVDVKDHLGRSPLHYAAANGNSQCTITLVRGGSEINELDLMGCSPLHYAAASHTFFGCLDYLLDSGGNPTVKNAKGYSAVHYAAAYGNKQHLEMVTPGDFFQLRESCKSITDISLAYYGHREALRLLCETLVSLDMRDVKGQTALHFAAQRGFTSCVEVLLEHQASCTLKEHKHKRTALHLAAIEGHVDCLLLLVNREHSADIIDSQDTQGQTALMLAAVGCHTDCVHILLEKGANPDAGDKKGFTALHRAVRYDSTSALLEHGASALCRDSRGRTALHLAASRGHTQLLHTLLQAAAKADPLDSMLDYKGYTPTHWAAYHGHEGCLRILLENKLFGNQEGNSFNPLHCFCCIILSMLCNYRTPLHAAAYSGNVTGLQLLLARGAELDAADHRGCSALMIAADCGHTIAVEFLLHKAKPDLTLVDLNNNTALHLACIKGHEMCALLLLGEINDHSLINATNSALQMPLHIAARKGLATVVQVLLSRGAAVMAVDGEGHTPALACAPNKKVADCLALILSTMKPFPLRESNPSTASCFNPTLNNCGIAATCGSNGSLRHSYVKGRSSSIGLHQCLTE
uniref:Ankyrin repeat domain 52 n=1 Tax=Hippocampus comes TaxID=109280 RepID=A0A3Q2ZKB9_HIPCM